MLTLAVIAHGAVPLGDCPFTDNGMARRISDGFGVSNHSSGWS
jgi:hypothetical protein